MQIIILSGGSGTRLWPLSNDSRSKQFLRLLPVNGTDERESMIQRVVRQIREADFDAAITVATSRSQQDVVISQIGSDVDVVTEPSRRKTFPAICLACEYLKRIKQCSDSEVVIVIPSDAFTVSGYFKAMAEMGKGIENDLAKMMVMGITPTYPSTKYGYVVPESSGVSEGVIPVKAFVEKPDLDLARNLIDEGGLWNGGVFAFRLGYMREITESYLSCESYQEYISRYSELPEISFDCEVAEKEKSIGMIRFDGDWQDLGTWNTLTDVLPEINYGNVITDGTGENNHILNELGIPLLCLGTNNLIVAASPDGIIVSERGKCENVKQYASLLKHRPMTEERRWGTYKVIDNVEFEDGFCALTKQLTLNPGCSISYQKHNCRDEVWTFIDGEGIVVIDGERRLVRRGDVVNIKKGHLHALKAKSSLTFIEVQQGSNLIEEDIERFDYDWDE